jgi:hypothetical protein
MLFKEIITVNSKNHETHKYKIQSYWLLSQVVHIVTALHVARNFFQCIPTYLNLNQVCQTQWLSGSYHNSGKYKILLKKMWIAMSLNLYRVVQILGLID